MDQPSFPPLSCWSIIFQTSPDNFSLQRLSFSVTAGGDERERERDGGKNGGIRAFSRAVPNERKRCAQHRGQLRRHDVVVSAVKAVHCRDRFERTRLKMEARKVLEARLWARKTRAGKQCTPLKRGGELKKGEEKEASSREGIRISIYRKLRGLWEESSPDITGRNARRNANRGRCWIRILGEEEKKRGRMKRWANEEETIERRN